LSRPHRLDFHGAIHLVHVRGKESSNIYFDADVLERETVERWRSVSHLVRFFTLLDACCSECAAQLFAYCVEPNAASFVMRTWGSPLEACMQRLKGRYSRYLHSAQVLPKNITPFASRYESKVVAPEYLPHAVRRVHAQPLQSGLARRAIDYPFSSAVAYVGERAPLHLETGAVWRALEFKGLFGLRGYREFMEKAETAHVAELFEQGSPFDARIVGAQRFVAQAKYAAAHPPESLTREQLIDGVAQLMGTAPQAFFGEGHQAVLGRALVAWFALRAGSASVREVASWFGVTAATVGRGIRHYRRVSPALFEQLLPGIKSDDREAED
jgi:hypothetical protein